MLINTCCGYESHTAYELCPDCKEHCDWEVIDDEEWDKRNDAENQIDELLINSKLSKNES
jgi:hypothetical protein